MGIVRMLWRTTSIGRTIDTVKNIVEEKSLVEGVKRTWKEDVYEDNPITSGIYKAGCREGKKEGYVEASYEYEKKLLEQADLFLKQKKIYEKERDAYEALLDEYEKEISNLMEKVNRTTAENEYLNALLMKERMLRKLAG